MRKFYILGLICLGGIIIGFAWAEQISFTAYYPAPSGEYRTINTDIMHIAPSDPSEVPLASRQETMVVCDSTDNTLKRWDSTASAWVSLGGVVAGPEAKRVRIENIVEAVGYSEIACPALETLMNDMSVTLLDMSGSKAWVLFAAPFVRTGASAGAWVGLYVDNEQIAKRKIYIKIESDGHVGHGAFQYLVEGLSPGDDHTIKIKWQGYNIKQPGASASERILIVAELNP